MLQNYTTLTSLSKYLAFEFGKPANDTFSAFIIENVPLTDVHGAASYH